MNTKKLFPEKKELKKGLAEFLYRKGFYIVLLLCVAIVGATAFFLTMHNVNLSKTNPGSSPRDIITEDMGGDFPAEANEKPAAQSSVNSATGTQTSKTGTGNATDANKAAAAKKNVDKSTTAQQDTKSTAPAGKTETPKSADTAKAQKYIMPVSGETVLEFAHDKLVYSKTLEDYRTHDGIDLAADRGVAVKAVADGVVSEVITDPRLGITVVIEHQGGMKTFYSNLAGDDMVAPNQKIKQGDVIGCVGNSAGFESAEQSHLHFEVWKNNEPVNPATYLPAFAPKS